MVTDDPVADIDALRGAGGQLFNDATWLMTGDHVRWLRTTVSVEVGPAETRCPNLKHGLARSGVGIWKLPNLGLPIPWEGHSAHIVTPAHRFC
jgi:hypothetical protein